MKFRLKICLLCFITLFFCIAAGCGKKDEKRDIVDIKISRMKEIEKKNNIAKSFYFIVDLHWEMNTRKSPDLVKKIRNETGIDDIVFGGDYIERGYDKKADALKMMKKCVSSFGTKNYIAILGNHDMNTTSNENAEEVSDTEAIRVLNNGKFEKSYFTVEDRARKIGNIFLNTNCFTESSLQYSWLEQKLCAYQSDWTVLIFMHEYNEFSRAGISLQKGTKGILLDQLLLNHKQDIFCKVAGVFSAHSHRDYFDYNSYGCPIVSTTCDAINVYDWCDNLYQREKNTFTEQAFDVVQLDTAQRKVFLTRIGAGVDRTYNY